MEPPDFKQIARDIPIMSCEACAAGYRRAADGVHYNDARGGATWGVCRTVVAETRIVEQFRQVWNARGAADLDAMEPIIGKLGDTMDPDNARDFVGDAVRSVDQ